MRDNKLRKGCGSYNYIRRCLFCCFTRKFLQFLALPVPYVDDGLLVSRCPRCKITRRTRWWKLSLESVLFSRIFVMYYVYVTSRPSLLIESTDSMMKVRWRHGWLWGHHTIINTAELHVGCILTCMCLLSYYQICMPIVRYTQSCLATCLNTKKSCRCMWYICPMISTCNSCKT